MYKIRFQYVIKNNTPMYIYSLVYNNINESKIRRAETNCSSFNTRGEKMKIEIAFNGHLENCVCEKCHQAREFLQMLRGKD